MRPIIPADIYRSVTKTTVTTKYCIPNQTATRKIDNGKAVYFVNDKVCSLPDHTLKEFFRIAILATKFVNQEQPIRKVLEVWQLYIEQYKAQHHQKTY